MNAESATATDALRPTTRDELVAAGLDPEEIVEIIRRGCAEDLGAAGDITSLATIDEDSVADLAYVTRQDGVLAGMAVLRALVDDCLGPSAVLTSCRNDGDVLCAGDVVATLTGQTRALLAVERLSLNLLGHLCGIASVTRKWVEAVAGTGAQIRDTRKTTPGLRNLEKYAVRCGGGVNHRRGLDDAVLIKDNHVASAGGVGAALDRVAAAYSDPSLVVQVEVDTLEQLDEALAHGAQQILLDNFTAAELAAAVDRVRTTAPGVMLEASGGLRITNAREVAATGVDYLAVGALTHSAASLDIGLDPTC